jgi:myo-inositol-1(or 4)-monophosphatase
VDDYLTFAKALARQGGELIKTNANKSLDIELKSDHSPVTQVDKAINDLISRSIRETYPDHGLLGEEGNHGSGDEPFQWLCDPLDGTKAFILGVPLNTCILGLTQNGQLLLAVVYNPFADQLYYAAKGQGAFCNDQRIAVNQDTLAAGGCVIISESSFQFTPALQNSGAQIEPLPGAGYRSMLIASGRACASIQGKADFHDVGPASLIVEEAGGRVTDLNGTSLRYNQPLTNGIVLSNGICHDDLLAITARGK